MGSLLADVESFTSGVAERLQSRLRVGRNRQKSRRQIPQNGDLRSGDPEAECPDDNQRRVVLGVIDVDVVVQTRVGLYLDLVPYAQRCFGSGTKETYALISWSIPSWSSNFYFLIKSLR